MSYDELCRQLAFRAAGDTASFDVIRLAYSLLTYYSVSTQLAGTKLIPPNAPVTEDGDGDDGGADGGAAGAAGGGGGGQASNTLAVSPPNLRCADLDMHVRRGEPPIGYRGLPLSLRIHSL